MYCHTTLLHYTPEHSYSSLITNPVYVRIVQQTGTFIASFLWELFFINVFIEGIFSSDTSCTFRFKYSIVYNLLLLYPNVFIYRFWQPCYLFLCESTQVFIHFTPSLFIYTFHGRQIFELYVRWRTLYTCTLYFTTYVRVLTLLTFWRK